MRDRILRRLTSPLWEALFSLYQLDLSSFFFFFHSMRLREGGEEDRPEGTQRRAGTDGATRGDAIEIIAGHDVDGGTADRIVVRRLDESDDESDDGSSIIGGDDPNVAAIGPLAAAIEAARTSSGTRGVARWCISSDSTASLRSFHLKGGTVDATTADAIGEALATNRTLVELRLTHNRMEPGTVSRIADGLRRNRTLEVLDAMGNALGDACIERLCESLAGHKSLQFLCLDFNDFGHRGVESIASMLVQNASLHELHLFGNRIDSKGAGRLAESLRSNATLETLILSFNQIGDEGAAALARALTVNSTLTKLWFPSNSIGSDGLLAFGGFLPSMKGLEQLNVGDFFDAYAAEALIEGLKSNTKIFVLYMECPFYEEPCVDDRLDFYLRLNRSGRRLLHSVKSPRGLWAYALEKAGENTSRLSSPDVLFHMLREKPDLFNSAEAPPQRGELVAVEIDQKEVRPVFSFAK